jgi:hypothetical protein
MQKAKIIIRPKGDSSLVIDGNSLDFKSIIIRQIIGERLPKITVETYIKDIAEIEFEGEIEIHAIPIDDKIALEMFYKLRTWYENKFL